MTRKKTQEEFSQKIYELTRNAFTLVGSYIDSKTPVRMKHNCCGHEWKVSPGQFLDGSHCPRCSRPSRGETKIVNYLKQTQYDVRLQVSFDDCRHMLPLKFDFGIYIDNNLHMLIEYQGQQHYKAVKYWGGEQGLKYRQMLDNIKRDYCHKNNIHLLEISYQNDPIDILRKVLT